MPGAVIGGSVAGFRSTGADSDAEAWADQVVINGGTVSAGRLTLVSNFISGLKADAVWTKCDRFWLEAAENQPSALTDLVARELATAINSPTFTVDRGYTGNSTSNYISTPYNPVTDGVAYVLASAHLGAWIRTVNAVNADMVGGSDDGNQANWFYSTGTPSFSGSANGGTIDTNNVNTGHQMWTRTGTTTVAAYSNGSSSGSSGSGSSAIPSLDIYILAQNAIGSPNNHGGHQLSAFHMGGGLTATDVSNLFSRLQTYMTAVGA